jgi:hypothetical protein
VADLDVDLRTVLLADSALAAVTTSVHINHVPENKSNPYVWVGLDDTQTDLNLDGTTGPTTTLFVVEATSTSLSEAKTMQNAIKAALHGKSGAFGTHTIAFARIDSLDDSYISRQQFGDQEDYHVSALTLFIGTDSRS